MATKARNRKSTRRSPGAQAARNVTCGQTMQHAHSMLDSDSMALVLDSLTQNNWDHIFIVDHEGAPMGRLHAVDLLKLIARKTVNRDIAWMHSIHRTATVEPSAVDRKSRHTAIEGRSIDAYT